MNYSRLIEIVSKIFDETIDYDKVNNKSIPLSAIIDDIYDEYKKDKADKAFENFYKRDLAKLVDWHILEKIETTTSSNIEISYKLHKRLNHLYRFILEENFNSYDVSYILILNTTAVKINKFDKEITNSILENQGFGALVHFSMPIKNLSNDFLLTKLVCSEQDEQSFRELLKRVNSKMGNQKKEFLKEIVDTDMFKKSCGNIKEVFYDDFKEFTKKEIDATDININEIDDFIKLTIKKFEDYQAAEFINKELNKDKGTLPVIEFEF